MGLGKVLRRGLDQVEGEEPRPGRARGSLESLEALERDAGGSGDELEEPSAHLLGVALDDLPEPAYDRGVGVAVFQAGVGLPVLDVDLADSTWEKIEMLNGFFFTIPKNYAFFQI